MIERVIKFKEKHSDRKRGNKIERLREDIKQRELDLTTPAINLDELALGDQVDLKKDLNIFGKIDNLQSQFSDATMI